MEGHQNVDHDLVAVTPCSVGTFTFLRRYEWRCFVLGCDATQARRQMPTFRRNVNPEGAYSTISEKFVPTSLNDVKTQDNIVTREVLHVFTVFRGNAGNRLQENYTAPQSGTIQIIFSRMWKPQISYIKWNEKETKWEACGMISTGSRDTEAGHSEDENKPVESI